MSNELTNIGYKNIKNLIYTIRGRQVMMDTDVAMLYECETRIINQAMKRNTQRFPERFCFQISKEEFENLKSQIVISSFQEENKHGGRRNLPYVFTEQGISMLAPLLKSKIAVRVSINIMDAFVEMRKFVNANKDLFERVVTIENKMDQKFISYDNKFEKIFNALQTKENFKQKVFFEGQIYDAYSLIIDIIKEANNKIVIIDNYIDDSILNMLVKKNKGVEVIILTSDKSNISKLDIQKFNEEYQVLKIAKSNKFHDRFIIIDNKTLYHCGASIKDLGKKCFAISKLDNKEFLGVVKNII
jgi:hypothetical protein